MIAGLMYYIPDRFADLLCLRSGYLTGTNRKLTADLKVLIYRFSGFVFVVGFVRILAFAEIWLLKLFVLRATAAAKTIFLKYEFFKVKFKKR